MSTVVLGRQPVVEAWLERRRALGQDGRDEVWEGTYHVAPHEHARNGILAMELAAVLREAARRAGLRAGGSFNLGEDDDYRVPDLGFHDAGVTPALYHPTAPLVVEVLSPDDETYAKFDFYARHRVQELWVADPLERTLRCWQLREGAYREADRSSLLGLTMSDVVAQVDWP